MGFEYRQFFIEIFNTLLLIDRNHTDRCFGVGFVLFDRFDSVVEFLHQFQKCTVFDDLFLRKVHIIRRTVNPQFASVCIGIAGMVECIAHPFADQNIVHLYTVENIVCQIFVRLQFRCIFIDENRMFDKTHLPHTPECVHKLFGMSGIKRFHFGNNQVVKNAVFRHDIVDKIGSSCFQKRQKNTLCRPPHIFVFQRRFPDHCRQIDRLFFTADTRHIEYRILLFQRIVSGVVAKRSFDRRFFGIDKTLYHKVRIFGNIKIVGDGFYQSRTLPFDKTVHQQLKHPVRKRCRSSPGIERITADRNGNGHLFACCFIFMKEICRIFVNLPVHSQSVFVINLQAVHAEIFTLTVQRLRIDLPHRDKRTAVL